MVSEFVERFGLKIPLPDNWEFEETTDDEKFTASLFGSDTSFWTVSVFFSAPDPEHVIDQALNALREEYDDLQSFPAEETVCDHETVAFDAEFVCLEWTTTAHLRCFRHGEVTLLIYYQGTDHELEESRSVLSAITQSLQLANA